MNAARPRPSSSSAATLQHFLRNKWVVAAHIGLVYFGVTYYMQGLIRREQTKRDQEESAPITATPSSPEPTKAAKATDDAKAATTGASIEAPIDWRNINNLEIFDRNADRYDAAIRWEERVMFLTLMRKRLMKHARGRVLEVSAGTGRNIPYYPSAQQLESVTFLDASRKMLEKAMQTLEENEQHFEKWVDPSPAESTLGSLGKSFQRLLLGSQSNLVRQEIPIEFYKMDVGQMDFPDNTFDTVVQTFGLCSVGPSHGPHPESLSSNEPSCCTTTTPPTSIPKTIDSHPVKALNEMARVCKPDGHVLLLEHGKASYDLMNERVLDPASEPHFHKWGCWVNRDIEQLVAQSDLEVEYYGRWNFGTTHYIVAKPKKDKKEQRVENGTRAKT